MHAYLIIAHNQFELLERLIRCIDDERNDIYIHIDAKVKNFDFDYFSTTAKKSRIFFTDRIKITWGDFSQVRCEQILLRTALKNERPGAPYTYFHMLSGVDLPIKTNNEIHDFFDKNQGKEFIHYSSEKVTQSSVNRIKYYHFFRKRRNPFFKVIANIILKAEKILHVDRLKNKNINVQKGCNWFSITRDLAEYIVSKEKEIEKTFNYSYCCDEVFIQTVVESSDFKNNLFMPHCNNDHYACVRYIDWNRGHPYTFREADFDEIMSSGCMFARKFSMDVDSAIVEKITQAVLG